MTVAQKKNLLAQKLLQTEGKHILKAVELLFNQEEETFELVLRKNVSLISVWPK